MTRVAGLPKSEAARDLLACGALPIYAEEDRMNTLWTNGFPSSDWNEALNSVLILVLLLSLLLLRPRSNGRSRVQSVLFELAAARPDEVVSVIVQKAMTDSSVEELVARLGGTVTRDLPANAFAAELPAQAILELARAEEVSWVSLDTPVTRMGDPGSPDNPGHPPRWNEIVLDLGHSRNPTASHSVHNRVYKNMRNSLPFARI
jgi:hypothetical protein